jgi:phosphoglycolate phosphatase
MAGGILFDLDGTLLDTLGDLADSMNDALGSLALPAHPRARYRHLVGDGAQILAARATPPHWRNDPVLTDAVYRRYVECYSMRWQRNSLPYPGIPALLDACASRGLAMAVYSNKPDIFTQQIVQTLLPRWPWAAVRGQRPGTPRKPAPEGALALAAAMNLSPADCLFLGDSGVDMACAAAAGMCGLGALWGFREQDELLAAGARALVAHPHDVLPWLDSSRSSL